MKARILSPITSCFECPHLHKIKCMKTGIERIEWFRMGDIPDSCPLPLILEDEFERKCPIHSCRGNMNLQWECEDCGEKIAAVNRQPLTDGWWIVRVK